MGTASSESASSASKVDTGGAGEPTTYSYAEAGSKIAGPFGPSPVLPATTRSVLTKADYIIQRAEEPHHICETALCCVDDQAPSP